MAPFVTSWPIQSCAPTRTSGPLPAAFAVMKSARVLTIAWTPTVMPFASAKASATAWIASSLTASVQMTSSWSPRTGAPVVSPAVGAAVPSSVPPSPPPQAEAKRATPAARASIGVILRILILSIERVAALRGSGTRDGSATLRTLSGTVATTFSTE
jgi:hypothetical protein